MTNFLSLLLFGFLTGFKAKLPPPAPPPSLARRLLRLAGRIFRHMVEVLIVLLATVYLLHFIEGRLVGSSAPADPPSDSTDIQPGSGAEGIDIRWVVRP